MHFNENIELWQELTSLLTEYFEQNKREDCPVVNYQPASSLMSELNLKLDEDGCSHSELFAELKKYLKYSVRTTHPQFNNQLQAGANFESLLGEVVSFVTNTTMATYEVAPVASLIESKLIDELNKLIGHQEGGGIMLTGGSNANMLALHCARNSHIKEVKFKGNQGLNLCVFASEEAHYSFKKAVMLLGIGLDNLILIKADKNGKMVSSDLESQLEKVKSQGRTPLMIASTFGTTVKGAFDPIEDNQRLAEKFNVWHHIDAAWGGAALFSSQLKDKLELAKLADSFTFDAHKVLSTGIVTSFLLTKRKSSIFSANSGGGCEYLFHHYENSEFDTGKASLQCGRKVDALKLWLSWKSKGHLGMQKFVDQQLEKARYLTQIVKEHPRLKLVCEPEYLNVCFQVIPENDSLEINQFNLDLRFKMVREGNFLVNFSSDKDGTTYFRFVFSNEMTQKDDIDKFISHLLSIAKVK